MPPTIAGSVAATLLSHSFDLHILNASANNEQTTKLRFRNGQEMIHRTIPHLRNNNELPSAYQSWSQDRKITINIRGTVYETLESTLAKYPNTLLGCCEKREQYYNQDKRQLCFNCNREAFDAILFYYQSSGKLIRPHGVNEERFLNDLAFFEIDPWNVAELEYGPQNFRKPPKREDGVTKGVGIDWDTSNTKNQYTTCKVLLSWLCAVCVVVYLFTTCLSSLSEYQSTLSTSCQNENSTRFIITQDNPIVVLHFTCSLCFVLEFILRFGLAASKIQYVLSFMGAIDIISALSTLLQIMLRPTDTCQLKTLVWLSNILRTSSFVCILKFSRFSRGLRLFGQTLKACFRQFILSVYCIGICLLFFSAVIYFSESSDNEDFESILDAFWYTIITITTVGYGDLVPLSVPGRLFGAACSVFGATIVMAWPATIFVSHFTELYNQEISKKIKKKNLWARAKYKFRKSFVRIEKIRDQN